MGLDLHESAIPTVQEESCTGCGRCVEVCASRTLAMLGGKVSIATRMFMGCIGCGQCAMICPTGSITVAGRRFDAGDLVELSPLEKRAPPDALDALLLSQWDAHDEHQWIARALALLLSRRSVRTFRAEEIDRAVVERILAMTSTAPMGIPPSEVGIVVFHGREKVRQLAADAVGSFRRALKFFRPLMLGLMRPFMGRTDYQTMRDFVRPLLQHIVEHWDAGEDVFAYEAPLAMLFHAGAMGDPADSYIAATYAMIAGQSLGLGSCMLGTTAALAHDPALKAKYGIPRENKVGLGLLLGYPAVHFQRGVRRRLASVTFA